RPRPARTRVGSSGPSAAPRGVARSMARWGMGVKVLSVQPGATGPELPDDVGDLEQNRGRERDAQGLGRLLVDREFEPSRLLDGQITWLHAFENLVHVPSRLSVGFLNTRPIGHQPTRLGEVPEIVYRRQPVLRSEANELHAVRRVERVR